MQSLSQHVAREQAADRIKRSGQRQRVSQTLHPPSQQVRWRVASAVARLAIRLDADAARVTVK